MFVFAISSPFEETKVETPKEDPGSEDPAPVKAARGEKLKKSSLCVLLWERCTLCAQGTMCALTQRADNVPHPCVCQVTLNQTQCPSVFNSVEDVRTASLNKIPAY